MRPRVWVYIICIFLARARDRACARCSVCAGKRVRMCSVCVCVCAEMCVCVGIPLSTRVFRESFVGKRQAREARRAIFVQAARGAVKDRRQRARVCK